MNRTTQATLLSPTSPDLTTGNACWETAPAVWAKINQDFGPFQVDLCADAQRHRCPLWFGPGAGEGVEDARTAPWSDYEGPGFANPPYGAFLKTLLPKAVQEAQVGFHSLFLLPCRFAAPVQGVIASGLVASVYLCTRRLVFWEQGAPRLNAKTGKPDPAPFDSMLVHVGLPPGLHMAMAVLGVQAGPNLRLWVPPTYEEMSTP